MTWTAISPGRSRIVRWRAPLSTFAYSQGSFRFELALGVKDIDMYQASSKFRKRSCHLRRPVFRKRNKSKKYVEDKIFQPQTKRNFWSATGYVLLAGICIAADIDFFFVSSELQFLPLLYTNLLPALAEICMAARSFNYLCTRYEDNELLTHLFIISENLSH